MNKARISGGTASEITHRIVDKVNDRITGQARLAGVLGYPVSHSLSPVLHNYWLERLGIDGAYVPLPVSPEQFSIAVHGLQAAGFRGANVTIPHKEAAFAIADDVDPMAHIAGSVNTLVFGEDGRIRGSSTDGFGFIASLEAEGIDLARLRQNGAALLLGAGGAARSIATALLELGFSVIISNRTEARAHTMVKQLSEAWRNHSDGHRPDLSVLAWDHCRKGVSASLSLLVNTTSLGMTGGPDAGWKPDLTGASDQLVVSDIVYVPRETPLLREASERGLKTVGGLGMLLHQARPGFRSWFGIEAEVDDATIAHVSAALKR